MLGLKDNTSFDAVNDVRELIERGSDLMRLRNISVFGTATARHIGGPLTSLGDVVASGLCPGSIDNIVTDSSLGPDGLRVSGHIDSALKIDSTEWIYVVNTDGRVVGLATQEPDAKKQSIWDGFAVAESHNPLRAFVRLRDGRLCPLEGQKMF